MCPNCRAFITTSDKICPYCEVAVGPKAAGQRTPSEIFGGLIPHAHFTTVVILLINLGLYVAMGIHASNSGNGGGFVDLDGRTMFDFGAKFGPAIRFGEWWRLLMAGFLHGGLLHIAMNSWVLYDLGARTEESFGTPRYLFFYFLTTITGFYASYWWRPDVVSVGSSAGIFGLIGAMIALGVRDRSIYGSAVRRLYTQWALYGLVMGFVFSYTDNAAHIGGLLGGFAIAYLAGTPGRNRSVELGWKFAAGIAVALTALAFGFMFRQLISGSGLQ